MPAWGFLPGVWVYACVQVACVVRVRVRGSVSVSVNARAQVVEEGRAPAYAGRLVGIYVAYM